MAGSKSWTVAAAGIFPRLRLSKAAVTSARMPEGAASPGAGTSDWLAGEVFTFGPEQPGCAPEKDEFTG
jgi:hypothetical protein